MQLRKGNISKFCFRRICGNSKNFFRKFLILFLFLGFGSPRAFANAALVAVAAQIQAINAAMALASKNPQEIHYRQAVQTQMSLLPATLIALAMEFQKAKELKDKHLPMVQAMLGGLVDPSAPARFKNLFKSPSGGGSAASTGSKPVISSTGTLPSTTTSPSGFSSSGSGFKQYDYIDKTNNPSGLTDTPSPGSSSQIAAPREVGIPNIGVPEPVRTGGKQDTGIKTYAYDPNGAALNVSAATSSTETGNPVTEEAKKELLSLESQIQTAFVSGVILPGKGPETSLDDEKKFFREAKEKEEIPTRNSKRKNPLYLNDSFKPGFMNRTIQSIVDLLFGQNAYAEEGEGGQKGADWLFGIAAIIQAAAPIAVAGIQSSADKAITKMNNQTQKQLAQMTADSTKYGIDTQKQVTEMQAQVGKDVAFANNAAQTQRLNMNLAQADKNLTYANADARERRDIETRLANERVQLAYRQADDSVRTARATLNANLTAQGLVTGASALNSSNSLSFGKNGSFAQPATPPPVSDPGNLGNALAGGAGATPPASGAGGAEGFNAAGSRGLVGSRDRLLDAVRGIESEEQQQLLNQKKSQKKKPIYSRKTLLARGLAKTTPSPRSLAALKKPASVVAQDMSKMISAGSSRSLLHKIGNEKKSGFTQFRQELAATAVNESYYRGAREPRVVESATQVSIPSQGHSYQNFGQAYRAPQFDEPRRGGL